MLSSSNNKITKSIFIGFFLSFWTLCFSIYYIVLKPNTKLNKGQSRLYIYPSTSFKKLYQILENKQYLRNNYTFLFLSKILNYQDSIHPGSYVIKDGMNNWQIIKMLKYGLQTPVKITFNNIKNIDELLTTFAKNLCVTKKVIVEYHRRRETFYKIMASIKIHC